MEMLQNNISDVALVLEGGGMRASYTSAALNVMLHEGIYFNYVVGISAGATEAGNYLSRDFARVRRSFVNLMLDRRAGGLGTVLHGRGYFDGEYIFEHTAGPDEFLPFDWETFDRNPAQMRVGTFNSRTGETKYWGREDFTSHERFLAIVRASASIPIAMNPVTIDGDVYFDGGIGATGGIPLDAAIADGYERFFIVLTRPRAYVKQPQGHPRLVRRLLKEYPLVADALFERAGRYMETKRQILELEAEGKAYVFWAEDMMVKNGERNAFKLGQNYELGEKQAWRELPKWKEFLGL